MSKQIKVVVHIDIVVVVVFIMGVVFVIVVVVFFVVDPKNLPLKYGQNWVPSS